MSLVKAAVLAATVLALPALAADPVADTTKALRGSGGYGTAGCGLGALAFGNDKGAVQIIAATLNGTSFSQTFGMMSGTSNCGPSVFAQGTRNLVEANRLALAKDVARGQGDLIVALSVINACADKAAVGSALQRDFGSIFPSDQASDEAVTEAILRTLRADPALGCGTGT